MRIEASDFPVGVFSFITPSLNLSEDGQSSGELVVLRSGGLMGVATIRWVADVVPGVLVASEGSILFSVGSTTPDSNIVLQLQGDSVSNIKWVWSWVWSCMWVAHLSVCSCVGVVYTGASRWSAVHCAAEF